MHTLSGRRFEIGTKYAPTIRDIAIGLSRIPRWAGATIRPWSVLQHSLVVGALVVAEDKPVLHLAALMHDMEEMATGDIPKPYKTKTQAELGKRLRDWLYSVVLVQPNPDPRTAEIVHAIDSDVKFAELLTLCHPRAWADPYFHSEVAQFFEVVSRVDDDEPGVMVAIDAVWDLIDMPDREAINIFTSVVTDLLASNKLQAMRQRA
jgi:hypothetical protein